MTRRHRLITLLVVPVLAALASCAAATRLPSATLFPSSGPEGDALHTQAEAMLAAWEDAASLADPSAPALIGDLTAQVGDWEEAVGDNNKRALMAGVVVAATSLSDATPPAGVIRWSDGTAQSARLLSAADALADLAASTADTCADCQPLEVTGARLTTGSVQTSRGPAIAPMWEFTIAGTSVKVTRVAAVDRTSVAPLPWDAENPPAGLSIDSAIGGPEDRVLTVTFVGAPGSGDEPCGADYAAEAVESALAVAVIVVEHRNAAEAACRLVGAERTATVVLATPLGERAVLEVKQGLPVPVLAP